MSRIKRALISVYEKEGIVRFARGLKGLHVEIVSTGGTARLLQQEAIPVKEISDFTGFPEILEGRVKTLHPRVHGGILGRRSKPSHVDQMKEHGIEPIDLVVVNLYPFEKVTANPACSLEEALENIDIGGPTLIRAASKNFEDVVILVDPQDYEWVMEEFKKGEVSLSRDQRARLAAKAFAHTARYDAYISRYLSGKEEKETLFPKELHLSLQKVQDLRYGENPHQKAAFYRNASDGELSLCDAIQHQGKELSYNNILDTNGALGLVREFQEPAVVIVKHGNPCGVAVDDRGIEEAFSKAWECDPMSAFGGVIACNRPISLGAAQKLSQNFVEVLLAPTYESEALKVLSAKKGLRVLELAGLSEKRGTSLECRAVQGGFLVQTPDDLLLGDGGDKIVTKRSATPEELKRLRFAWKVCKHVRSNAIVFASEDRIVAVGAGQMSRVDSVRIAGFKGGDKLKGAAVASDAFFPFRDGVDLIASTGATAIIQPGGSVRDEEVIAAANERGMAMVFTGIRHFRH
ncbi:MAG: bifunctional phosphoribosylaminoimidazolecarboxamide formyltransferase/IMP cyclohydrolase [Deltaproteobacteria bacterium]|nr:bifunctional phosphoribosylaminoimidazolecarboxamide formyltransferase/IMP cyclohydrolase [Deltaproteobacteria bacterium]